MKRDKPYRIAIGSLFAVIACGILFASGYYLTILIYGLTGRPPEIWMHVFSGFVGFFLIVITAVALMRIFSRRFKDMLNHQTLHNELLLAMKKIAQGDFNVFLDMKDDFTHKDFAEGINQLAKNLGTLENMRQDFVSNVSHEIQSPLTSISGFAALLKNDALMPGQKAHYLNIIEAESKRLSSLSDNLLKLSALETSNTSLSMQEYRLDKQLEEIALVLEPQWSVKNINLEAELNKLTICGDEGLLSQVWINLLHNAIKFTPEGGSIKIILQCNDAEVCCQIADTGIGIAPQDQMHIFQRFYKVDKSHSRILGGNGLGLALVKKIVELHNGRITLESEIGKGTAFYVFLPRLHSV